MTLSPKKVFISLSVLAVLFSVGSYTFFAEPASGQNCVELPSGLVVWWDGSREQPTNTTRYTALDVGGKNNGTILSQSASPYQYPGKVGEALLFGEETTSDFRGIVAQNSANLNFGTGPFSLEAWFKWESGGKSNINNIIRKSRSAYTHNRDNNVDTSYGAGYWLRINQRTQLLEFFTGDTGDDPVKPRGLITTPVSPEVWHHVVATRNGSGTMKLYLDGELRGTKEVPNADTTNESLFTIGGWANPDITSVWSTAETFKGFIDEISVYNRALSQSEVTAIFNADSAGKCSTPAPTPEPPKSPTPTPNLPSAITYPVTELGNCASQQDCKAYCGIAGNYSKCSSFAQKNNLITEVPDDKKAVFAAMQKGESPGGCTSEVSCRTYCEDIDHLEECVNFVEKFKLASSDELKEMRQMADVKKAGAVFPGNCKTKENCLTYCENSAHAVECMEFAQKAGFIPKEDAEAVSKILPYLKSGGKLPGGCTTKESCDAYCASDTNADECVDFGVKAGFMTQEDAEIVKKAGGKGPGNCKSKEDCDSYCKDEKHIDECVDFAVKTGLITKEEAEMGKKMGISSGPGGCKSKAECESFCALSENQETCFNWAKEHGMDTSVGGQAGPGGGPPEGVPEGIKTSEDCAKYDGDWTGEHCDFGRRECIHQGGSWDSNTCNFPEGQFRDEGPQHPIEQGPHVAPPPGSEFRGPGGCSTPEECQKYCESNPAACQGFSPPGGEGPAYQSESQIQFLECQSRGGSWDGTTCRSQQEVCASQGGVWEDSKCYFRDLGAPDCTGQGGAWDYSEHTCKFPPSPSSFRSIPLLGAMLGSLFK